MKKTLTIILFTLPPTALLYLLFDRFAVTGASYNTAQSSPSLFFWLKWRWIVTTPFGNDFPYGWAVPLVSLAMIFIRRRELAAMPKATSWVGFFSLLAALVLLWLAARTQQPRLAATALVLALWSIPFHLFGWPAARALILPCAVLIFTMPFDLIEMPVTRLRAATATLSAALLNGLGVPTELVNSTTLRLAERPDVVAALSYLSGGIRSLMYLLLAASLLVWHKRRGISHLALLASGIPVILLLASAARVVVAMLWANSTKTPLRSANLLFYLLAAGLLLIWHHTISADWRAAIKKRLQEGREA